jgi:hypothetical protein
MSGTAVGRSASRGTPFIGARMWASKPMLQIKDLSVINGSVYVILWMELQQQSLDTVAYI